MWEQLKIQNNDFLIKKVINDEKHIIYISNLIEMWGEELTTENFYQRCKKLNPLIEGEQESLIKWILSLLNNETTANITVIKCDDSQVLEIKSKLSGIPFIFKFYLISVSSEKFYKEMTLPLLFMIQQFQAQRNKLFDLLKKKDIEISEYKMEGAKLSRKNIETATFSENQFKESCSTITIPSEIIERPTALFTHDIQMLYTDVQNKYDYTKALIESANEETDTEDSGTQSTQCDSSPEKKRKLNEIAIKKEVPLQQAETNQTYGNNHVKVKCENKDMKKQEEKILARQRKQAMKKKLLPL